MTTHESVTVLSDEHLSMISEEIIQEIYFLKNHKLIDVEQSQTVDVLRLDPERQDFVDDIVNRLSSSSSGAEEFRRRPGIRDWSPLLKRAIALQPLYNAHLDGLAHGIKKEDYRLGLFEGGLSAIDLLELSKGHYKSDKIVQEYETFIDGQLDDGDETQFGTRDIFLGVLDARAVRTRATEASSIIMDHISATREKGANLISASLACGAAEPVYNLAKDIREKGFGFKKIILADSDPMALATSYSLANRNCLEDVVELQLKDLLSTPLTEFIPPHSVDVVDILGLFEYLDFEVGAELLRKVRDIVSPNGIIVFGNMLDHRPQQKFFEDVVKWPKLKQRSISEVLTIISEAGYSEQRSLVRVPSEGVYAVYGIKIGDSQENLREPSRHLSVVEELGIKAIEAY